jgi:hypothetical protein
VCLELRGNLPFMGRHGMSLHRILPEIAPMTSTLRRLAILLLSASAVAVSSTGSLGHAHARDASTRARPAITYADVAGLADSAPLVVHARLRKLARVGDVRSRPAAAGKARFYVVAETRALITGGSPIGQSFAYLVDLPVDAKGRPMARKKDEVILFARPVSGREGELQLVRPDAQIAWSEAAEAQVRAIVTEVLAPGAPARVTGVRELMYVPGTLAGEGETQIFLTTADSSAASITVRHQPNQPPQWGASFSELVAELGHPPARNTLEWYRLACFLPANPPASADMSEGEDARRMAQADYRMVIASLGPCARTL